MPAAALGQYRILIPELLRGSDNFPVGTVEKILALGAIVGDWLILTEDQYLRVRSVLGSLPCRGCGQ